MAASRRLTKVKLSPRPFVFSKKRLTYCWRIVLNLSVLYGLSLCGVPIENVFVSTNVPYIEIQTVKRILFFLPIGAAGTEESELKVVSGY